MASFTNTFGGTVIYPANVSYRAVSLTANVTLTWPTEVATDTNTTAAIMDVTPTGGSFTIRMPEANQGSVGETVLFFNPSAFSFTIADNGGNTITTVTQGQSWQVYLTGNTTANGTWRALAYGVGSSSVNAGALAGAGIKAIGSTLNQSIAVAALNSNYTIGNADRAQMFLWTGGSGTLTLPSASAVGNDWFCQIRNSGTGAITITPPGGETIDDGLSLMMDPGNSAFFVCDGTDFYTLGLGQPAEFTFDYISIDLTGETSPYTLSGAELNRIAYQFSGTLTANMVIIVPATVQQYWVDNSTSGAYTLTVKTLAGTGVAVVQGSRQILYCDGTDVLAADTGGLAVPITVAQGGTGATTANGALVNLGGTSVGIAVFTAVDQAAAQAAIGVSGGSSNDAIVFAVALG